MLINRYRIENELGRGGFGAVYAAWDVNLNRKCALKENLETTPEAVRQFTREATLLANLSHPNLPRVTDHFSIPDRGQYLVMDYVEGEDLLNRIQRQGLLEFRQALAWVLQVCDALVYLHSQEPPILHRDIKPANIRITPEGKAVLVDFGLVKEFNPQRKTTLGARAVTPGYAPPEQYGRGMTDSRTDIYALGATLYNLLSGLEPLESIQRIIGKSMLPIREMNPGVPPQLEATIERAMALDPEDRYQSVEDFQAALRACLEDEGKRLDTSPKTAQPVAPTLQMPESQFPVSMEPDRNAQIGTIPVAQPSIPGQKKRRPPWLLIGLGGTILIGLIGFVVVGGLLYFLTPSTTRTPTRTTRSGVVQPSRTPEVEITGTAPVQPTPLPVVRSQDPATYVHLSPGEPDTLDPALDYETSGAEIISNVYDTLIFYKEDDPNTFIPQLALEVPSSENGGIQEGGRVYRFRIRPGVLFHNGQGLTPEDVAYTFQRAVLQGGSGSPQWLFTEPLFGVGIYDISYLIDPALIDDREGLSQVDPAKLRETCERVKESIRVEGDEVVFRLAQPWSPFLATMAASFGSIVSRQWVVENGGWDGDCATWQRFYAPTLAEINQKPLGVNAMGTGPFILENWEFGKEIVLKANENYWVQEPAWEGAPSGAPAIKRVMIRFVDDFGTRLSQLQAAEADSIDVDSNANWQELDRLVGRICRINDQDCQPSDQPDAPLELIRGGPSVVRSDLFFTWEINVQGGNDYVGSGRLDGNGIPPNFFSNVHVRRAFAYCFDYDRYLTDILSSEGIRTINVMLPGMVGYNPNTPYYVHNRGRCEDEMRQAEFNGQSVWETGFWMVFPFNTGNFERQAIGEIFREELSAVNPKFKLEVRDVPGSDYFAQRRESRLPIFPGDWLEDIHDPHNWLYPYVVGLYSRYQGLPPDLRRQFEDFVNRGVSAVEADQRRTIYFGFNELYYEQAPAILLFSTMNRHYQQRWVNGYYDNTIYPGIYFYALRKD